MVFRFKNVNWKSSGSCSPYLSTWEQLYYIKTWPCFTNTSKTVLLKPFFVREPMHSGFAYKLMSWWTAPFTVNLTSERKLTHFYAGYCVIMILKITGLSRFTGNGSSILYSIKHGNSVVGFEVHVLTLFMLNYAKENNITKNQNTRSTIILFKNQAPAFTSYIIITWHLLWIWSLFFGECFEHAFLRNIQKSSLHLKKYIHKPSGHVPLVLLWSHYSNSETAVNSSENTLHETESPKTTLQWFVKRHYQLLN